MKRSALLFFVFTGVLALATFFTRDFFAPFVAIFLWLFAAVVLVSIHLRRSRTVVFNLAFVFLALALFEAYYGIADWRERSYSEGPYLQQAISPDPIRGYAHVAKPASYRDIRKRARDGRVIYDATYAIDAAGLRVTPSDKPGPPTFFFGDSFTFGEGVADQHCLPYLYSLKANKRSENFGVGGYGPHQMLRSLEVDLPGKLGRDKPDLVVYTAIMVHIDRATGAPMHGYEGPYYEKVNGATRYVGRLRDAKRSEFLASKFLRRSELWMRVVQPYKDWFDRPGEREQFVAIIERAKELAAERYGASFLTIIWDVGPWGNDLWEQDADWVARRLTRDGVAVIRLSERLPHLKDASYYISGDGHPNAKAYNEVANLIISEEKNTRRASSLPEKEEASPPDPTAAEQPS